MVVVECVSVARELLGFLYLSLEGLRRIAHLTLELTRDTTDLGDGAPDLTAYLRETFRTEEDQREYGEQKYLRSTDASHGFSLAARPSRLSPTLPLVDADDRFERLLEEAETTPFEGWDFSSFEARNRIDTQPWDYKKRVEQLAGAASTMVDLGTGGGEFVASLDIRAPLMVATEGWMPNVPMADRVLRPLGVHVVAVEGAPDNALQRFMDPEGRLPFLDGSFDLVIDRHEAFRATEVARVLRSGGRFLTQQVGSRNEIELNEALGTVVPCLSPTLDEYVAQLERAGLNVTEAAQAFPKKRYLDVGVLIYFLRAVPWQYEGFDTETHRDALRTIHATIERESEFVVHMHRILLEAEKP